MSYTNYYPASGMFHVSLPLLMGTRLDALLFGEDGHSLQTVWAEAEILLRQTEKMLNRYDSDSEVARINDRAQFSSVSLSDELWNIFLDCRRYCELTDGCFDITLRDFSKITVMEDSHSILFGEYGLTLDFGGYAKGYALKRLRDCLTRAGIQRALINFGNSSVLATGSHPYGDSWPVGIEEPFERTVVATVGLRDASLSVSGNSPARPQHIIRPQSGTAVDGCATVAVVSVDPVVSEVLTTAWIASGAEHPVWLSRFETLFCRRYILPPRCNSKP